MRIAVLGGGNGSFAAAGDFALAGHDVRLWRRDRAAVEAHRKAGSAILVKDFRGRHEAELALVTNDIAEAMRDAELILCPAPATAQPDIAHALAPHLRDGQAVFLPPGTFGSYIFAKAVRDAGNRADAAFAETGTLPWLTRKHGPHYTFLKAAPKATGELLRYEQWNIDHSSVVSFAGMAFSKQA